MLLDVSFNSCRVIAFIKVDKIDYFGTLTITLHKTVAGTHTGATHVQQQTNG